MHSSAARSVLCPLLFVAVSATSALRVDAQRVRGRIVDDQTRQALNAVEVTIYQDDRVIGRTTSGADGFFQLRAPAPGEYHVEAQRLGFAPERRLVALSSSDTTLAAFVLRAAAVRVDSVEVSARPAEAGTAVGFSRSSHILSGERMATLERHGARVITALRELGTLRIRETVVGAGMPRYCVESNRGMMAMNLPPGRQPDCNWVVFAIDGIVTGDPEGTLRQLSVHMLESVQYPPPVEAGYRYGHNAGSVGVIEFWTIGHGPHVNPARRHPKE